MTSVSRGNFYQPSKQNGGTWPCSVALSVLQCHVEVCHFLPQWSAKINAIIGAASNETSKDQSPIQSRYFLYCFSWVTYSAIRIFNVEFSRQWRILDSLVPLSLCSVGSLCWLRDPRYSTTIWSITDLDFIFLVWTVKIPLCGITNNLIQLTKLNSSLLRISFRLKSIFQ